MPKKGSQDAAKKLGAGKKRLHKEINVIEVDEKERRGKGLTQ